MSLLGRRLLVVTGKGGVGRTTVSAALALAAADRGLRAGIIELNGQARIAEIFDGGPRSYAPRRVAPRVDTMSMEAVDCLGDFGRRRLRLGPFSKLLLANRVMSAFLDAVPGFSDLLQLGKIEHLVTSPDTDEPRYDVLIIDAPATGHGLTLLEAPRTMAEVSARGPFHDLAATIEALLSDPARTAVVVATLLEELPVTETLELVGALERDRYRVSAVFANRVLEPALSGALPWSAVRPHLLTGAALSGVVALADRIDADADAQQDARRRLVAGLARLGRSRPLVDLPDLGSPPRGADLQLLASALGGQLG